MPKGSDDQSFFINGNESWKVLSSLLELESFTLALSIVVLEGLILVLLLDGCMQVVKSCKVLFSLFELESFIFTLAMDVLEGFILVLQLKTIREEKKDGKTRLLYD